MSNVILPELAAALLAAQGVPATPEGATGAAEFSSRVLSQSASAIAKLAFEDEPSGYTGALRRHAP